EVEVAELRILRLAYPCNGLSSNEAVAGSDRGRLQVSVERYDVIPVIHDDQITVSLEPLRKQNCSTKHGMDFRSGLGRDLHTVVECYGCKLRVLETAERLDDLSGHRPAQRALDGVNVRRRRQACF